LIPGFARLLRRREPKQDLAQVADYGLHQFVARNELQEVLRDEQYETAEFGVISNIKRRFGSKSMSSDRRLVYLARNSLAFVTILAESSAESLCACGDVTDA
jgi:hypothetical protein